MRIACQIGVWNFDDTEGAIAQMGQAGLGGIEVFTTHLEPYHADPAKFRSLLDAAGIELSGAYYNNTGFVSPEAEDAVVAEAVAALDFMQAIGQGTLVANGGILVDPPRDYTDAEVAQFAKVLNRIGAEAEARGRRVVMHPHLKCTIETPEDVDRLLAAGWDTDRVGLCVHAAHQLIVGADPYAIYEQHADLVSYAHIGEYRADGGALIGRGDIDQQRLMKPLLDAGFDGWLVIESRAKDVSPADNCKAAMTYMKSTWPRVNWE